MSPAAILVSHAASLPAVIPSPDRGVWHLGPFPLRAYALFILVGIGIALWLGSRRWVARGGEPGVVADVAVWAVPFGVVGARIYHVITSPDAYFGPGGDPLKALRVWEGGLGIWGAVAFGAVGAVIGCRRAGVRVSSYADAVAPGVLIAQAVGRLGNWFNQELFGRPTDLPWALAIDPPNRPAGYEQFSTFHPTFLYELLWNLAAALLLLWLDRRYRLGHGQVFWAYVGLYTAGRLWIEALRIDDAERVLGLRLNIWTSILVLTLAVVFFVRSVRRHPVREDGVLTHPPADPAPPADRPGAPHEAEEAGGAGAGSPTAAGGSVAPPGHGEDSTGTR